MSGYTQAALNAFSLSTMWATPDVAWSQTVAAVDGAHSSLWEIASYLQKSNGTVASLASKKRAVEGAPSTMSLLAQAFTGLVRIGRETFNGMARRNATGKQSPWL